MPRNPTEFAITWLRRRGGLIGEASSVQSISSENQKLKNNLKRMSMLVEEIGQVAMAEVGNKDDSDDSDEDNDDDVVDELPIVKGRAGGGHRSSVSAEAYGDWNKLVEVKLPVYDKTAAQKERLQNILSLSFLFSALEEDELSTVLNAVEEKVFDSVRIIQEGDDGDCLYVVEEGSLECKKVIEGKETVVKTCVEGDVFGELALLYSTPRAASVDAVGRCLCWRLDRVTFNQVVKQAHIKRSEKYDQFVQSVSLFSSMEQAERLRIIECFKLVRFKQGDSVVTQGEEGNRFFIVEEGTLSARKDGTSVQSYSPGEYFGELALLKNQPRAATVVVDSAQAKLIWLDRKTFNKMLGPLQGILERRAASYT